MQKQVKPAITLKQIAESLKIPLSTVGNILAGDKRYSEVQRKRVIEYANKVGYRRNLLASGLRGGKTNTIGVLWSIGGDPDAAEVIRRLTLEFLKQRCTTLIADCLSDSDLILDTLDGLIARKVDSVVLHWLVDPKGSMKHATKQVFERLKHFHRVVIVTSIPEKIPFPNIVFCRKQAIDTLVCHWAETNRKKLAILVSLTANRRKTNEFIDACAASKLKVTKDSVLDIGPIGSMQAKTFLRTLDDRFEGRDFPFDSIFCATDIGAQAAIHWLNQRGLKVPEDVAVAGFNDSEFCKFYHPPIASMQRPVDELCSAIMDFLFKPLPQDQTQWTRKIPYQYIHRESAG